TATISQLAMTFVFGLYAATVSLKIRNLWPLIIFHWLWDFMTFPTRCSANLLNYGPCCTCPQNC
ncbi:MAG: CPBP family intramembrane metalloprotease, partial [Cyclobacteriaceae bacterium]|nr:CPBP family intramembrane metalloprotease [Cyclobacteriaceae bacterium]